MPIDRRDSRFLWGGPVRAVRVAGDREIRGWHSYKAAEDWLSAHDKLGDWEIARDNNPAWALKAAMLPGPDGRSRGGPSYDTPDGEPHV